MKISPVVNNFNFSNLNFSSKKKKRNASKENQSSFLIDKNISDAISLARSAEIHKNKKSASKAKPASEIIKISSSMLSKEQIGRAAKLLASYYAGQCGYFELAQNKEAGFKRFKNYKYKDLNGYKYSYSQDLGKELLIKENGIAYREHDNLLEVQFKRTGGFSYTVSSDPFYLIQDVVTNTRKEFEEGKIDDCAQHLAEFYVDNSQLYKISKMMGERLQDPACCGRDRKYYKAMAETKDGTLLVGDCKISAVYNSKDDNKSIEVVLDYKNNLKTYRAQNCKIGPNSYIQTYVYEY